MKKNAEYGTLDLGELMSKMSETADPVLYQYYKGLDRHELLITSDINDTAIETYIMPLLDWDKDEEVEHIHIYVNCVGGSIFEGMLLSETISKLKTKTTVEILSYAYSMGGFIAMSGMSNPNVNIICHEFSTFLIHSGSTMLSGDSSTVEDTLDFYRKFNKKMEDFMLEHSSISKEKLKEMKRVEWFLTSDEMLEFGLVDEIV